MNRRILLALLCFAATLPAQKYTGPRPAKPDVPYLLHATNLVETEAAAANEEKRKDDTAYVVDGAASQARTPLSEPIFLFESKSVSPDRLQLYKLDVKNNKREVVFPPSNKRRKDAPHPVHLIVKRVADALYRIEANEFLQNGEYALTPEGSNQVFLFEVY